MSPTSESDEIREEASQTVGEEIANAVSHGVGLLAIIGATPTLIWLACKHHRPGWTVAGAAIFAATAALLYLASTLYHAMPRRWKGPLRLFDHMAIYVLIAGTYTPFALGPLRGPVGWTIFGVVWALAIAGVLFKLFARFRFHYVSTALYIGMGWLAVFMIRPLLTHVPMAGLAWLVGGGVAYTAGTAFYHREKMRYSHLIWHLFVLVGTACHFVAVMGWAV